MTHTHQARRLLAVSRLRLLWPHRRTPGAVEHLRYLVRLLRVLGVTPQATRSRAPG